MTTKVLELTEKIYNEGVAKAKMEAELIIAKAKEEADNIINEAKNKEKESIEHAEKKAVQACREWKKSESPSTDRSM